MNVAVDPAHQRRGVATRLLERLFELTADDERRGYTLEVRVSNEAAIQLYETLGFEARGVRRGYYTDNREDALIMWRDAAPPDVILAIETSCDETAAAARHRRGEIRSSVVASQAELHARFGGVVPEVASRRHLELVAPVVREALGEAGAGLDDLDAVAVTARPGLIGALLVGVSAAKALAWSRRLPLIPVNHLHGHVASLYLQPLDLEPPFTCLLASGGHTMLLDVQARGGYRVLGTTLDDAAGEAFDKGARLLGLGYPGGTRDRRARAPRATPSAYDFPVARVPGLDFSFSGLKTALLYTVRKLSPGRARRAAGRPGRVATSGRSCARSSSASRRQAAARLARRRRCGCELRAPRRAAGGGARAARALHRQRRDDRLGGSLRRARPVPRVPFARCACRLERSHWSSLQRRSPQP